MNYITLETDYSILVLCRCHVSCKSLLSRVQMLCMQELTHQESYQLGQDCCEHGNYISVDK